MDNSMYPPMMQLLLEPRGHRERSQIARRPKKADEKKITLKCFPGNGTDEGTIEIMARR